MDSTITINSFPDIHSNSTIAISTMAIVATVATKTAYW